MENPYINIPPVEVIVKGTGDGGAPLRDGQRIKTPDHQPDLIIRVSKPLKSLAIGFAADYGKAFVGLITAGITPLGNKLLYAGDFWHLIVACSSLALAGPTITLITNISTILNALKEKYPLMFGVDK